MDFSFNKAVDCNNIGAKHIDRDDCKLSIKALTLAFHSFKRSYNQKKQLLPPTQNTADAGVSTFNIDQWMKKMPYSESDDVVMYQHPIQIPRHLEPNMENFSLISTAITFNLALANHLDGVQRKNKEVLQTAARLYEYGFSLERIRGKFFISPFFLVAILNNLGSLHRTIESIDSKHEQDRSQKCFLQLLSTLLYLTQIKGANPSDLEVFFGNTTCGLSRTSKLCAGAA
jgi:hypothetical protein